MNKENENLNETEKWVLNTVDASTVDVSHNSPSTLVVQCEKGPINEPIIFDSIDKAMDYIKNNP